MQRGETDGPTEHGARSGGRVGKRRAAGLFPRLAGALLGGFVFSQSAEFTQQYLQRLGGAADELAAVVGRFDASAAAEGLGREPAVARLRGASDPLVARQGADAALTIERFEDVSRRYRDLSAGAPLLRPFTALADPDWPTVRRAFGDYRPAMPITLDGLLLAAGGFLGGWGAGSGIAGVHGMRRRRRLVERAGTGPAAG